MAAVRLKQVDLDYRNHLQAFLNFAVKAEKKAGKNKTKPVYTSNIKEIEKAKGKQHEKGRFLGLSRYLKKREK